MGEGRGVVAAGLGAVIAVLLQVVVAPNIALASALPNFVLAYALVLAVVRPDRTGPMLAFVLGLVFDLLGSGPVGAMAFLLVLVTFLASRAFSVLDNDTLFMPLVILVVSTLVVELFYAVFLMADGICRRSPRRLSVPRPALRAVRLRGGARHVPAGPAFPGIARPPAARQAAPALRRWRPW